MPKLCLALGEESPARLLDKVHRYAGRVALIECRLDSLTQPEVPPLPTGTGTEFIATCRPPREGGGYTGPESDRLNLLLEAARSGFQWVDVEHDVQELPPFPATTRLIRSFHSFDSFPGDLNRLYSRLDALEGDVVKIAVMVSSTRELVTLLSWMESVPQGAAYVLLGMGDFGQPSRALGAFLGNSWTFVAEEEGEGTAPGQFSLETAVDLYRLDSWNQPPDLYAVLGNPVAHSRSPWIHNRLFKRHGLDRQLYLPIRLDELEPWFRYLEGSRLSFKGFSVTLPFKQDAAALVSRDTGAAPAINTLVRNDGRWEGLNTDYRGFLRPLLSRTSIRGREALILGNGGVAHTVAEALIARGARVTVAGRSPERVGRFARRYGCPHTVLPDLPASAYLCVNTTPVGQSPDEDASLLAEQDLRFEWVYDLVYQPEETKLLELAARKGIGTISGMEMFVEQAALQFSAWTGREPDRDSMLELVRSQPQDLASVG
ncbi:MAG: type I 3-dehydroquinate dehydratase [Candidatus Aminicenantes bacterium]|nr:type I 3-dehydroquinate dehydratase [Candidatus Aminicenantes bacterium]